jgi:hypothetical protein
MPDGRPAFMPDAIGPARVSTIVRIREPCITQRREDAKMTENEIGKVVVDAALKVHRHKWLVG